MNLNKITLLVIAILISINLMTFSNIKKREIISDPIVYICDNGRTKVYHMKTSCSLMRRCKHSVRKTSRSQAIKEGLRASRGRSCSAW